MQTASWFFVLVLFVSAQLPAGETLGVVSNIKVLSDKVEDVSSFEAWKKAVIKEGMSDEQKALAAWETVVKFRHHDANPQEYVGLGDSGTLDAIKLFNVYGYCAGTAAQPAYLQLMRQLGYEARAWSVNRWGVPEVHYGGAWHMFDPGMIAYFKKADGSVASVEELAAAVKDWHGKNPGFLGNDAKIREFQKSPGISKGPELLANCPTYDKAGNFALNYFGWFSAMILYDGTNKTPFLYEEASSQGYRVNIQLRKGERLTRNWSNKGLHINADTGTKVECITAQTGKGGLYYTPAFRDLANGRVGNGTLEYTVPLSDANALNAFVSVSNVALKSQDNAAGALHVKDAAQPGEIILRMPSSYVYLTGELTFEALATDGGAITVAFSDNHQRSWKELAKVTATGAQKIDLSPHVLRRYDYRLKFTLTGKGTALDSLKLLHDIQHSQRPLPALDKGDNTINFSAGAQEGTISLEGAGVKFKGKQVTYEELGAEFNNINKETLEKNGLVVPQGASGEMTFPIETPGAMKRLRFGCNYRAGQKQEGWDLQVSFDDGKTFKTVGRAEGPTRQNSTWVSMEDIPPGTQRAKVRFSGQSRGNLILFRYRIDADYVEPHGGIAPVKITYHWAEAGQPKEHVQIARAADESYTINCVAKPEMKSITLERAE
ncbi:MAG TPA: hypothetical protein VEK08_21790 [Planctomycetota bacterium]|nr:hypothetical protein [Planctomycetota bacterium]